MSAPAEDVFTSKRKLIETGLKPGTDKTEKNGLAKMKYITDITNLKLNNTVVTIGKFDGNHIGHQYLYNTVVQLKDYAMDAVILTFGNAIRDVADTRKTIMTNFEKHQYAYPDGIDYILELPFTDEIKNMEPEEFIYKILVKKLGVKKIVVGNDFRFGKDRAGDIRTLYDLSDHFGYELFALEKVLYDGIEVSSTYIKEKIIAGDMEAVTAMLGEPFSVTGEVVKGKQLGRQIGFPTINFVAPDNKILPPDGGYATKTVINGQSFISITNIGFRPTVENSMLRTIETHIFDFDDDVYGQSIKVEFYKFLRPEIKYDSLDALINAIEENCKEVKDYFNKTQGS